MTEQNITMAEEHMYMVPKYKSMTEQHISKAEKQMSMS